MLGRAVWPAKANEVAPRPVQRAAERVFLGSGTGQKCVSSPVADDVADDVARPPANGRKAEAPLRAVETRHCEAATPPVRARAYEMIEDVVRAGEGGHVARSMPITLGGITLEKGDQILGAVVPSKSAMRAQPAGRTAKARPWAGGPEISVACLAVARLDGRQRRFRVTPSCRRPRHVHRPPAMKRIFAPSRCRERPLPAALCTGHGATFGRPRCRSTSPRHGTSDRSWSLPAPGSG